MSLATPQDVQRWLERTGDDLTAELEPLLEAAEERVEEHTNRKFDQQGLVTEKFYNVRWDDILYTRDIDPTSVVVKVFPSANDPTGRVLTLNADFQVLPKGIISLIFSNIQAVSMGSLEGASVQIIMRYYDRVEVTYQGSNHVPASVREATACVAAYMFASRPAILSNITSERLGDYSYTKGQANGLQAQEGMPDEALRLLRPYRRTRVRSV